MKILLTLILASLSLSALALEVNVLPPTADGNLTTSITFNRKDHTTFNVLVVTAAVDARVIYNADKSIAVLNVKLASHSTSILVISQTKDSSPIVIYRVEESMRSSLLGANASFNDIEDYNLFLSSITGSNLNVRGFTDNGKRQVDATFVLNQSGSVQYKENSGKETAIN